VLTGEYTGESDERREDESGHANTLRNQEQPYSDREGERCMVAGKRGVMRRPKQERCGLDSEWTWSAPDPNDDLVYEQRARGRNEREEDKPLPAFTLCGCSAEKPNKRKRDIQQEGTKSAESDRQHVDESLPACQPIDRREEVVIHIESLTPLFSAAMEDFRIETSADRHPDPRTDARVLRAHRPPLQQQRPQQ
jgi:hypothetical protein